MSHDTRELLSGLAAVLVVAICASVAWVVS